MYAYIFIETAKMGIDVVGESQLIGYPTQYPSVSLMNYNTSEPNARFWVLKLLKDNFGPGDRLMETTEHNSDLQFRRLSRRRAKNFWLSTSVTRCRRLHCRRISRQPQ
jgi:hypothetical protein